MTAATTSRVPKQRTTRRPTGMPSWPFILVAGWEKAGKSWSCAEASASPLIGRTLWIGCGEDDPDEYGAIEGADFEIVPTDGTFGDILAAVEWAVSQPEVDGKPTMVVFDSGTKLWDLLSDMAQDMATARERKNGKNPADGEAVVTMDLWNIATSRWYAVIDLLRDHKGPVLMTARLDEVVVVKNGKPTNERQLKVKAQKMLPFDVTAIVELPERGKAFLSGVKTTRMQVPHKIPLPGFSVQKLWNQLGVGADTARERAHSGISRVDPNAAQRQVLLGQIKTAVSDNTERLKQIAADWSRSHEGEQISETKDMGGLQLLVDDLAAEAQRLQHEGQGNPE